MSEQPRASFVSVKLSPSLRPQPFLLPDSMEPLADGDPVIVQSEAGPALGTVVARAPAVFQRRSAAVDTVHRILRKATRDDVGMHARQQQREQEAFRVGLLKIRERGLAMKLTSVEQQFDGSRLVFYFTAEGRIDFRELVRDLASTFRCRIEMRQIGVRDEAKMLGGFGSCGRSLCCSAWLQTFEPVSIKMAKQQELTLNPAKLSGLCGRLKCCLRYQLPNGNGVRHAGCGDEPCCGAIGGCCDPA